MKAIYIFAALFLIGTRCAAQNTDSLTKGVIIGPNCSGLNMDSLTIKPVNVPPIFFVDGKEVSAAEIKKLPPDQIESINVLKNASAVQLVGERGKQGLIMIVTKSSSLKKPAELKIDTRNL